MDYDLPGIAGYVLSPIGLFITAKDGSIASNLILGYVQASIAMRIDGSCSSREWWHSGRQVDDGLDLH